MNILMETKANLFTDLRWLAGAGEAGDDDGAWLPALLLLLISYSVVSDFATPWTAAHQAPLPSTISQSLLKLMSIEWVMLSNHLTLRAKNVPSPYLQCPVPEQCWIHI